MSDFRIKFGQAIGPEGTYAANSAATLITQGDTTPDVTTGCLFYTNNTSTTTISYFDVAGNDPTSQHQGKVITVFFRDALTSVANSNQVFLSTGSGGLVPANTVVSFLYHNSAWYETSRSQNNQSVVQTIAVGGTNQTVAVNGAQLILLAPSVTGTVITQFTGIPAGHVFRVAKVPLAVHAASTVALQGAANLWLAGTTAIVMNNSAAYEFVSVDGTIAFSLSGLASP